MTALSREKLKLGCCNGLPEDFVGIDVLDLEKKYSSSSFVQQDLNDTPWELPANQFKYVKIEHVLEHLKPEKVPEVFSELYRVCSPGGKVEITVPHVDSIGFKRDPTHAASFSWNTVEHFTENQKYLSYGSDQVDFQVKSRRLTFVSEERKIGKLLKPVKWFANRYPDLFERFLSSFFSPKNLEIVLEKPRRNRVEDEEAAITLGQKYGEWGEEL